MEKKMSRQQLLNIILENLPLEKSSLYNISEAEEAIGNIKRAFKNAGFAEDIKKIEEFCNRQGYKSIEEYISTDYWYPDMSRPSLKVSRDMDLVTSDSRVSNIREGLLVTIVTNTYPDKDYDTTNIAQFAKGFLAEFIYLPAFMNNMQLSEAGIERIGLLYSYYGLPLPEETKQEILKKCKEELSIYYANQGRTPQILHEYISFDIIKKLSLKKNNEDKIIGNDAEPLKNDDTILEEVKSQADSELTIDKKIDLIRKKLARLEELAAQEKELREKAAEIGEQLDENTSEQQAIVEEINNLKL